MVVGHEVERAFADILVAEVGGGSPRALVVRGEPGHGTGALLAHLARSAESSGFWVLAAPDSPPPGTARPVTYGPLVDAVGPHLAAYPHALPAAVRADLGAVFGSLVAGDPVAPAGRHRLHSALRELLEVLALDRPVLLVLDGMHRADPATVELLDHLLRHPPAGPVLLAVALQPGSAPAALVRMVDAAGRRGAASTVDLGPVAPAS